MRIHKSLVTFGTLIAMGALIGQAVAAASPADDLKAASNDLSRGKMGAALTKTEMAETGLLNEQQAGNTSTSAALDAVQKVHRDLEANDSQAAKSDMGNALNAVGASNS